MIYTDKTHSRQRLEYVDCAKAIGIFCVVYGHTQLNEELQNVISAFHMPLFFFISGYLFSYKNNANGDNFLKKRTQQLIVPYISINIVTYLFWLLIGRHVGADSSMATETWQPLVAAALCDGPNMVHDVPLWFLPCLFSIEMAYYPLFRNKTITWRTSLIVTFAILAIANYLLNPYTLPFSLGIALMGMVFYALGREARLANVQFNNNLAANLSLAALIYISFANERISMYSNHYGNVALFLIGSFVGIYAVMTICRYMSNAIVATSWAHHLTRFVSDKTLSILGYHLLCFSFLKGVLAYGFHADTHKLDSTIIFNLIFAIAAMAVCLTMTYVYDKMQNTLVHINHKAKNK